MRELTYALAKLCAGEKRGRDEPMDTYGARNGARNRMGLDDAGRVIRDRENPRNTMKYRETYHK